MHLNAFANPSRKIIALQIMALVLSMLTPAFISVGRVDAATLESREVEIGDSSSGTTTEYTYTFTTQSSTTIQSMKFEACTRAIGTCTAPTGMDIDDAAVSEVGGSRAGWTAATAFARNGTGAGGCTPAANVLCVDRTEGTSETAGARTIAFDNQDNPTTTTHPNNDFYIKITTYSDAAWATPVDDGTVASAIVNQLTLTATVEEVIEFCVGDTDSGASSDCGDITGTTVDIGAIDSIADEERSSTGGGSGDTLGYVMLRTNSANGSRIEYYGGDASGNLVSGSNTIGPQATEADLGASPGTAAWGMEVDGAAVDTSNGGATTSLTLDANFNAADQAYWGATSTTADTVATASTGNVVDDEMLVLDFHAMAAATTPTGVYSTTITFVATPTY